MTMDPSNAERLLVSLPPIANLTAAADLKQSLVDALDSGKGVEIDASAVQNITSPCWQILVAAAKSFGEAATAMPFKVTKPSPAFVEAAGILGITQILDLKDEAA
ncbi:MAG TPA: STAS domain-containing protein [Alphaproteobacteria bacterium]|nr:STAS domain-containing protein [Alphaproteobacteria bacterium]